MVCKFKKLLLIESSLESQIALATDYFRFLLFGADISTICGHKGKLEGLKFVNIAG